MKFFKKYDFKRGWYRILIFFLYDTFLIVACGSLGYVCDHPELLPSDLLSIGKYQISYYDLCLILQFFIIWFLILEMFRCLWCVLYDWTLKCFKKGDDN